MVAGGTGFIGSHLCERLLEDGHQVVCMDNQSTGRYRNIAHLDGKPLFSHVLDYDVANRNVIPSPFPPEVVFHLASPASPVDYQRDPIGTLRAGSHGTENLLALAGIHQARFILASTSEVYGDPAVSPQTETYWGNVNPVGLRSCYDESKRFAEALTMAYRRTHGMRTGIARIFNTYGPRMRPDDGRVVCTFIRQALAGEPLTLFGGGRQTRSFCYVSDLVDGLVRLMHSEENMPINLGNPAEIKVSDLACEIVALTGSKAGFEDRPLPEDDPKRRCPDISRAKKILGWAPKVTRREGLERTIAYFRERSTILT